jgi:pimeloyl-ACP methyl ester carboxylesterase
MDVGSLMFQGREESYSFTNADLDSAYQVDESLLHQFNLYSGDDTLAALYIGEFSTIANDTVILYLHGNAPSMNNFWEGVSHLANLGGRHRYGVMMYDYRGFGESTGTTTGEESMASDLHAAMTWLKDNGLTSDRMVVFANSLGSLPAGPAAAGGPYEVPIAIEKLVMEVPQSSADAIMQDATGLSLPSSMITGYDFDLGANMADYQGDLLWMHGTADVVAPIKNAEAAMDEHQGGEYIKAVYEGAGHGLRWDIGPEVWGDRILEFILL